METTGFSPPCSAETSGHTTSSGSYNPPLPPTKAPRAREGTETARSIAAPATAPTWIAEATTSNATVVDSPPLSQNSVRSSEEEQDIVAMAVVIQNRKELKELEV